MTLLSLAGILGKSLPIQDLERLWLESSCHYAVFDDNILEDTEWDHLGRELWARRSELSPYFCHACKLGYPAEDVEEGEMPLVTASGIDWDGGLPAIVVEGIRKDGPKRLTHWKDRLSALRKGAEEVAKWEAYGERIKAKRKKRP